MESLRKFREDEDFKNQRMARMTKAWADADTNGDGKLDRAEMGTWAVAMRAMKAEEGEWCDSDHDDQDYEIFNSVGEGDGFTMAELFACFKPWHVKFDELKAADGL